MDTKAVILAGGYGTRIRQVLPDVPKPMAPVLGRPFVEWIIRAFLRAGIARYLISTGYLGGTISDHFVTHPVPGADIRCVPETSPLGTAGGFLNCTSTEADPPEVWLVANGDSLVVTSLDQATGLMADPGIDAVVLGIKVTDASRYGTLTSAPDGRLRGFAEKQTGAGVINAGIYLFRHRLLQDFPDERPLSFEKDVFPTLVNRARVYTVVVNAPFLDIGTPDTLAQAEAFISSHLDYFTL